jgi:hypothetical protein
MAEFTEQIFDIIEKKDSTISTAESKLLDQLGPTEKLIFADIKKLIDKFNVSGGKIDFNDTNVELVNTINQTIIDAIQKSKMPSTIREFLRDFDTIKEFNVDVHSKLNGLSPNELRDLIDPVQRGVVQQTLDGLTGSGVDANFIEPVKQGIYRNIVGGATRSDLENYLNAYVVGTPELNGLYSRYVKQVSRDALGQFDGQVNAIIAEEFGLDAFRYVGSLIDDSRPQCIRWVGKRILEKSEMESQIAWANNNGSGMIPGTNPDNFLIFRGGYNCRHRAIPFKLTKSQRERLQKEQKTEATEATQKTKTQINEVKRDVAKTQAQIAANNKKQSIRPELLLTNQSDSLSKKMNDLIGDHDGAVELINSRGTFITLRTASESTKNGAYKFVKDKQLDVWKTRISTISSGSNGNCSVDNNFMNVKYKSGNVIEFKPVKMNVDVDELLKSGLSEYKLTSGRTIIGKLKNDNTVDVTAYKNVDDDGYKFWSVRASSNAQNTKQNVAPTIIHESNHLIQNANDKDKLKFNDLFKKYNFKLNDAPTEYGKTNFSEFWAESMTYYVFDNPGLKKDYPKIFDFVEEYLEKIGVDKTTIKIAK